MSPVGVPQQVIAILESEAAAAPKKELIPPRWGRQNASYWLKHTEADSQAFSYISEELHIAVVFCAAELQVSRDLRSRTSSSICLTS